MHSLLFENKIDFLLLAYETMDPSTKEQLTICLRYVKDGSMCEAELMRSKAYWARQPSGCRPGSVLNAPKTARQLGKYSITETFLRIFATLPVTTATGERSLSALKLMETYLRTSMQENRLNALAFLYINNDIKLDCSQVIDQFAMGNRCLNLK